MLGAGVISSIGAIAAPIEIETVLVGNAGNNADSTTYGKVDYDYYIGKYEVTTTQYAAFLNAVGKTIVDKYGLYNDKMADTSNTSYGCGITESGGTYSVMSGRENMPVNYVSFSDAARFCNWLTTGNTETGVYDASGSITRNGDAWSNGGVAIASENEWYKAAYYDPSKNGNGGYWIFPVKMDASADLDSDAANYNTGALTAVGSYSISSYYGTFDQGGNVWEWNESAYGSNHGYRGGAFNSNTKVDLNNAFRPNYIYGDNGAVGFRVVSLNGTIVLPESQVPEPQTYALFGGMALLGLTLLRRRNK